MRASDSFEVIDHPDVLQVKPRHRRPCTEPLRLLTAGSRSWNSPGVIWRAMSLAVMGVSGPVVVVHGRCDPRDPVSGRMIPWEKALERDPAAQAMLAGADWHADRWARLSGGATAEGHPAKWKLHGPGAGPLRNGKMVGLGAARMLAFPSAGLRNSGTLDCARRAHRAAIGVAFWCDGCDWAGQPVPCPSCSLDELKATWDLVMKGRAR